MACAKEDLRLERAFARHLMNQSLTELLQNQLRDLYDAECQYERMLPRMVECCTDKELRAAMAEIAVGTSENIDVLKQVCRLFEVAPDGLECEAMAGLIREARRTADQGPDSATLDAALIANAQRIAHYEIAGFGTASAFAKCLSAPAAAALLSKLAEQAGRHDVRLTKIATGGWFFPGVNDDARQASAAP